MHSITKEINCIEIRNSKIVFRLCDTARAELPVTLNKALVGGLTMSSGRLCWVPYGSSSSRRMWQYWEFYGDKDLWRLAQPVHCLHFKGLAYSVYSMARTIWCLFNSCISSCWETKGWHSDLHFSMSCSGSLPRAAGVERWTILTWHNVDSGPGLTYLIPQNCCRPGQTAHQKQTASLCKTHQETLPGICGCHPWAETLPYTLPGYRQKKKKIKMLKETKRLPVPISQGLPVASSECGKCWPKGQRTT